MSKEFFDGLPVSLEDLLYARSIESNRIELKAGWDEKIKTSVVRTVCAFANDFLNLGGGYLILGVREEGGRPVLPPAGLGNLDLERLQKEVRGACKRIVPDYLPLLFPVQHEGVSLLVIWAPGGDTRPYQAPEDLNVSGSSPQFWIRRGPETIKAQGEDLRQLMALTAKVPFDDRRNLEAQIEDLSPLLVRRLLKDIGSDLIHPGSQIDDRQIFRLMNLVVRINSHEVPRNVGLIFFNEDPDRFFRGTRTEIVQFGDDAGGDLIEERVFRGPVPTQIKSVLDYLDSFGGTMLRKVDGQPETERTVAYPYGAMEEALVNAFYHRGYDGPAEPVKVYLYPDRMEIISYPGPVPGIQHRHLEPGGQLPPVPSRNRRIGDFLKELRLAEGRGSGIPKIRRKMRENGSPEAQFDFDEERTYFRTILPVHPRYQILHALREAGYLWATGEKEAALENLERSFERLPDSAPLATQAIEYALALNNHLRAERILEKHKAAGGRAPFRNTIANKMDQDLAMSHHVLKQASASRPDNPEFIYELAHTKIELAQRLGDEEDPANRLRLYREAVDLLRKALQLSDDPEDQAFCWFNLARALKGLNAPRSEVESAFQKAISLLPDEPGFQEAYKAWSQERS